MVDYAKHLGTTLTASYRGRDDRVGDSSIHVSDLIEFCPREYWLCRKHDRSYHGHKYFDLRAKWDFSQGHAIQRIKTNQLITQGVVFAAWECRHCGRLEVGFHKKGHRCP